MMHFATTKDALAWATQQLAQAAIPNARREVRWLLEHVLLLPAGTRSLVADTPLNAMQQAAFTTLVERRARRVPLQYLLETVDFAGVTLRVTPAVLIPRPETELLVEHAAAAVNRTAPLQCADLGTGSGCIAVAVGGAEQADVASAAALDFQMRMGCAECSNGHSIAYYYSIVKYFVVHTMATIEKQIPRQSL